MQTLGQLFEPLYNRVHSYWLADIKGASTAGKVAKANGGKGSEKMGGPSTALEL
jgi:hypothetical protein